MGLSILLGTSKGAFLVEEGAAVAAGPFCEGWPINHVIGDPETGTIWAGGGGDWNGAGVWRSRDGGATWTLAKLTTGQMDEWAANDPGFAAMIGWTDTPAPFGKDFSQIWSLHYAHGVLYAGAKPARLLRSHDMGETWEVMEALTEDAADWQPGGAGLTLHSIASHPTDPDRMWLGISAEGVFATEDGGATWERRNRLSNAGACADHHHPAGPEGGEVGHCVHNMMRSPGDADVVWQQNHHGVWRSSDGGRSWDEAGHGLPSTFGFPIRVHPRDPDTAWTLPLNGDMAGRFPPDAACAIWRTRDGGQSWQAQRTGLPQEGCYFTVLRQAMAGDAREPAGIYFGTNSGSVFASRDEGDTWEEVTRHLPTILSVEVLDRA